jgi:hypothetical protein
MKKRDIGTKYVKGLGHKRSDFADTNEKLLSFGRT